MEPNYSTIVEECIKLGMPSKKIAEVQNYLRNIVPGLAEINLDDRVSNVDPPNGKKFQDARFPSSESGFNRYLFWMNLDLPHHLSNNLGLKKIFGFTTVYSKTQPCTENRNRLICRSWESYRRTSKSILDLYLFDTDSKYLKNTDISDTDSIYAQFE